MSCISCARFVRRLTGEAAGADAGRQVPESTGEGERRASGTRGCSGASLHYEPCRSGPECRVAAVRAAVLSLLMLRVCQTVALLLCLSSPISSSSKGCCVRLSRPTTHSHPTLSTDYRTRAAPHNARHPLQRSPPRAGNGKRALELDTEAAAREAVVLFSQAAPSSRCMHACGPSPPPLLQGRRVSRVIVLTHTEPPLALLCAQLSERCPGSVSFVCLHMEAILKARPAQGAAQVSGWHFYTRVQPTTRCDSARVVSGDLRVLSMAEITSGRPRPSLRSWEGAISLRPNGPGTAPPSTHVPAAPLNASRCFRSPLRAGGIACKRSP